MNDFVSKLLEQRGFVVSKVRVIVQDLRDGSKSEVYTYRFGDTLNTEYTRRDLAKLGYSLISAEIVDTRCGDLSLENLYEALKAEEEA